jgi:PDZ domain-containing protein
VALVVLVCLAALLPVPYVTLRPGPTRDVLAATDGEPIVEIEGRRTYPTDGSLSLTTVSVTSAGEDVGLLEAFQAWFSPSDAIVPRDAIYDPEQSVQQVEEESAAQMTGSQETAAVAALRLLGEQVPETDAVAAITEGGPADGRLEVRDVLVSIDGEPVDSVEKLQQLIMARQPGDEVTVQVRRDGELLDVTMRTAPSPDDESVAIIGISATAIDYDLPFEVQINLGADIGGPSAGTVFALAIYDMLTRGSLTGGMDVAGTGSIEADGTVRGIGGIQQKVVGAEEAGAVVFLVPEPNCPEALGADVDTSDITLVEVTRLEDAVESLTALADDPSADVPTCG